jgi:pyruvate-ferredoxin/flavodoxin oxidoreductase
MKTDQQQPKYPGTRQAMDGNTAVVMCERESTDAAGAYPITPSTQMGEYWAEETAKGHLNVSDRPLIFIEPEGEHAAAAVTAGLSMTGLRATNFSSGQGIAYMHESLYAAVGKRLTYVLNMGCRAITKSSLNVHAGHDDYHAVDDTGFFQLFGCSAQAVCDLNIISHRIAELALNPGIIAQDGFLTTHLIESLMLPERELIAEYLGKPDDIIDTPTPAQRMMYGDTRRRVPELWDVDNPVMTGTVQNQDAYMQSVAAQRPYFFDHVRKITDRALIEFAELTGREYKRVMTYRCDDADYLIVGQGSVIPSAQAVADYLRETRGVKVGVVDVVMYRPFPGDLLGAIVQGRKGVTVLERTDQPLAEDLPLIRELRATIGKCLENGAADGDLPYPDYAAYANGVPLYSGCYGMGSRDLQPEGIVGAIENMVEDGAKRRFFYLSIDFVRDEAYTPKQEIHQQAILDGYPNVKELAVHGSENPNLMPDDSITVRFHSVGGWGAITTGKNLAMTLFDLLGYHIKANPKYGSEKKGQPTTYYLSAAPEPIRINCEYHFVDVVLSPDPNVFGHTNAVMGLKKGGVFIVQSDLESPEAVWQSIPVGYQQVIVGNDIRVFYLDAFKIAREEATDPELQFRMQGIAFQGAFFAASPVMEQSKLTEETLFKAIRDQLQHKFGSKGARVVEDNLRVVRRGFDEIAEITEKTISSGDKPALRREPDLPVLLKGQPASDDALTDIHRFWEQTGNFYLTGKGNDNLTDPFIGLSVVPAATGVFRDMTQIRFEHPEWVPEKCTACGACYSVCPDSAIPGLVNTVNQVFDTAIARVESGGNSTKPLRKALRAVDKRLRAAVSEAPDSEGSDLSALLPQAIADTIDEVAGGDDERAELEQGFARVTEAINGFKFGITRPYYSLKEKQQAGSGGLFSITVNPYTCKGCMECVQVCDDEALVPVTQTADSIAQLRENWQFWSELPTTPDEFKRIDDLDERIGALDTLLLDKSNYQALVCGDGACLGCGEKTAVHLFVATVQALMQQRVQAQVTRLDDLIARLETHIRLQLADSMDLSDPEAVNAAIKASSQTDMTLSSLSAALDRDDATSPVDTEWLQRVNGLLARLRRLRWNYMEGTTGRGRSTMGIINSTGCTSVWGSTYPYNPYPFPWANHLFQDSPSMAMGIFEGHMAKMADGFKAIRMTELELDGMYDPREHDEFFTYFNWRHFSDDEFLLSPPVVAVGGDGAMFDIGFQNLSRMLMSGKPIKAFILDTQVYSNTGGQACTSGFTSQVSDMAQFGKAFQGKEEIRKEIGYIAMAHRTSFVMQSSISHVSHLLDGFIEGLNSRRPALFNIYSPCMPEHGIGDDSADKQAKLAVESRAFPLYRYNPDTAVAVSDALDLGGNPATDDDWPTYTLDYVDENGEPGKLELPLTFADFAVTEGRFRKQFKKAPRDAWNENMVPLAEFVDLDEDSREGLFPFIWALDRKKHLMRVIPAEPVVAATAERRDFWRLLKGLAGLDNIVDPDAIAESVRADMARNIASSLMQMASGSGGAPALDLGIAALAAPAEDSEAAASTGGDNGYVAPWIDSSECTACDECMAINGKIFVYNDKKQAVIKDADGGPYEDLVKAAEKCTAQVIHPGTPRDPSAKGMERLLKRAEKYNI